jgi:hypothetical protein
MIVAPSLAVRWSQLELPVEELRCRNVGLRLMDALDE